MDLLTPLYKREICMYKIRPLLIPKMMTSDLIPSLIKILKSTSTPLRCRDMAEIWEIDFDVDANEKFGSKFKTLFRHH